VDYNDRARADFFDSARRASLPLNFQRRRTFSIGFESCTTPTRGGKSFGSGLVEDPVCRKERVNGHKRRAFHYRRSFLDRYVKGDASRAA